jgi:hypothetical protein
MMRVRRMLPQARGRRVRIVAVASHNLWLAGYWEADHGAFGQVQWRFCGYWA